MAENCDCPKTCPNCGYDLVGLQEFTLGSLSVIRGAAMILWRGVRVPLTLDERLLVSVIARGNGAHVSLVAMCEAIDYEGTNPASLISVRISGIKKKFRALDPYFSQLKRFPASSEGDGSAWWEVDDVTLNHLRNSTKMMRALHKLLLLHPGSTLQELADLAGVKFNTIWSRLKRLEKMGLAERGFKYQRAWRAVGSMEMHRQLGDYSLTVENTRRRTPEEVAEQSGLAVRPRLRYVS